MCVDLIGPYSIKTKHSKELSLLAMTMCDPASGWFEVHEVKDKSSLGTAHTFDQQWLCRYPRPTRGVVYDNGSEFLGKEFQEMLDSYGLTHLPTTVKNPQANYVERVHQTWAICLEQKILAEIAWGVRSTVSTVTDASPGQIVFSRDMIFDRPFTTPFEELKQKRQQTSDHNVHQENKKRIKHGYKPGDQVMLDRGVQQRKLLPKRDGPYNVVRVYNSMSTIKIHKGVAVQNVSIQQCKPYYPPGSL